MTKTAIGRQRVLENRHRAEFRLNIGVCVFLIPYPAQRASFNISISLSPLAQGPFKIQAKLNDVTYQLKLPEGCRVNPSFHVSRLIQYRWATPGTDSFPDYFVPDPDPFLTLMMSCVTIPPHSRLELVSLF